MMVATAVSQVVKSDSIATVPAANASTHSGEVFQSTANLAQVNVSMAHVKGTDFVMMKTTIAVVNMMEVIAAAQLEKFGNTDTANVANVLTPPELSKAKTHAMKLAKMFV